MNFLSSILILAGVFALNDAIPSVDFQTRLFHDQVILKNLRMKVLGRDAFAVGCSQTYLKDLTVVLDTYNSDQSACNDSKQAAIDSLNKEALEKMLEFKSKIDSTCSDDCSSMPVAKDALKCIQTRTLTNSKLLSAISVEAATYKTGLNKNISDTEGIELVCTQKCNAEYSDKSDKMKSKYENCLVGENDQF